MSAPDAPAGGPCAGRRLALFDLDGTLLCGPSAERRFAAWLFSRRHAGVRQAFGWLGYALSHLAGDGREAYRVVRVDAAQGEKVDVPLELRVPTQHDELGPGAYTLGHVEVDGGGGQVLATVL